MLSSIPLVGRLLSRTPAPPSARNLPAVPVVHTETDPEKRVRTLKYLLKGNNVNHSLIQIKGDHDFTYNDIAYLLYATYMMGGSTEELNAVFGSKLDGIVAWPYSKEEIARIDWRDFFGQAQYQRAYIDFFEDVLAEHKVAYNWHTVVQQYLLGEGYDESNDVAEDDNDTDEASKRGIFLRHCLLGAAGAPILHLACAFELDSRQLAMEGLALASATYREDAAQFLQELQGVQVDSQIDVASLETVLEAARNDSRFSAYKGGSSAKDDTGSDIIGGTFKTPEARAAFVESWRRWDLAGTDDLTPKLKEAQHVFVNLLLDESQADHHRSIATVLSISHGVRVLLSFIPAKYHLCILQQWWLLALAIFVKAGLPAVKSVAVEAAAGKDWRHVNDHLNNDQLYMMVLQTMRAASKTWPDESDFYTAAAVRFADLYHEEF